MKSKMLAAAVVAALALGGHAVQAGGGEGEGGEPKWFPEPTECPREPDWGGLLEQVKNDADFYKRFNKGVSAAADYVKSKIPLPGKDEAELLAKLGDALFGPCK